MYNNVEDNPKDSLNTSQINQEMRPQIIKK